MSQSPDPQHAPTAPTWRAGALRIATASVAIASLGYAAAHPMLAVKIMGGLTALAVAGVYYLGCLLVHQGQRAGGSTPREALVDTALEMTGMGLLIDTAARRHRIRCQSEAKSAARARKSRP